MFDTDTCMKLFDIADKLGKEEILAQLAEEAAELSQAASKLRRSFKGLTPVEAGEARRRLTEEIADVMVCVKALSAFPGEQISFSDVRVVAERKIHRWYGRTFDEGEGNG